MWWLLLIVLVASIVILASMLPRLRKVVHDYEWGLYFRNGRLHGVLEAGSYWVNPWRDEIRTFDGRRRTLVIGGQEIVTSDNVGVKVSLVVLFELADPETALRSASCTRA